MRAIELFVVLLLAAAVTGVIARRVNFSNTTALLLLGLLSSLFLPSITLTSEIILLVFLPPLLFEAAFALDIRLLWQRRRGVFALALPGVILAALVSGTLVHWTLPFPWSVAFLFGAIIAATDPVSVLATLRQLQVEKRLGILLEGESLFNDGVALALFLTLVTAVGGEFHAVDALRDFIASVSGGAVVGLVIGYLGHLLIALVDDHLTEMLVSVAVAYGAFLAAEELHVSGVIAVLAAAMLLGYLGRTRGWVFSDNSERLLKDLWEFLAFVANAALFLLMGLTVRASGLVEYPWHVFWAIVAALVGRAVVAYGFGTLLTLLGVDLTWPERHMLFWGGLRGAVALAAALSLPGDFPFRAEVLAMTYGVVLFTLLVQGLTMAPLVRLLGLRGAESRPVSPTAREVEPIG